MFSETLRAYPTRKSMAYPPTIIPSRLTPGDWRTANIRAFLDAIPIKVVHGGNSAHTRRAPTR